MSSLIFRIRDVIVGNFENRSAHDSTSDSLRICDQIRVCDQIRSFRSIFREEAVRETSERFLHVEMTVVATTTRRLRQRILCAI